MKPRDLLAVFVILLMLTWDFQERSLEMSTPNMGLPGKVT